MTRAETEVFCADKVAASNAAGACETVLNDDYAIEIAACVMDYQVSDLFITYSSQPVGQLICSELFSRH